MAEATNKTDLETARARLEAALSGLAQGVASSRDALNMAAIAVEAKNTLAERVSSLEQENLKLHEQVAALALQPTESTNDTRVAELEAEKAAINDNFLMLKQKFAQLQDQLENQAASTNGEQSDPNAAMAENNRLKQIITEMEAEKTAIKGELDKTIGELESMLEDA